MKKKNPYKRNFKYYYNRYGDKIKIGYAVFRYINGELCGLAETSFSMFWSTKMCDIWEEGIPERYFNPKEGDFIIKTSRIYHDLEILGQSDHKSNYLFQIKK